jgi:hypothetical protein
MKSQVSLAFILVASLMIVTTFSGCTGVPASIDVNPEFREQMKGKTIGQATGDRMLWGQTRLSS